MIIKSYVGELSQRLDDYRKRAREEAEQHRPPSDASTLDKHESHLQSDAQMFVAEQRHFLEDALRAAGQAVSALRQRLIQWRTKCEQMLLERSLQPSIEAELAESRQSLIALAEQRMRSEVELRAFKGKHGITEQAKYPESRLWHLGIVAVFAVSETVINAFFYENEQGLIGGVFVAAMVSALNLGGAILLGWGARYRNLKEPDKRLFGWFCFAAFVVFALYFNALFASFRAEYQLINPDVVQELRGAFGRALQNAKGVFAFNLRVTDFASFILFGLGLLLSSLAFWKGLTLDDKYPGHGALDRKYRADADAERAATDAIYARLKGYLKRRLSDVQLLLGEPAQLIAEAVARSGELTEAGALFQSRQEAVRHDFELVVTAYRQANMSVRATAPPAYYSTTPPLALSFTGEGFDRTLADLKAIQDDSQLLRTRHEQAIQDRVHAIMTETNTALSQGMSDFCKGVDDEAQDRINRQLQTIRRAP